MKTIILNLILPCLFIFNPGSNTSAQIVRGTSPGEIYMKCLYQLYGNDIHYYAIFRSTDNGADISLQDSVSQYDHVGGNLLSDSDPGHLYLIPYYPDFDTLGKSEDYGVTWLPYGAPPRSNTCASGGLIGEIYKQSADTSMPGLFRSTDYGSNFISVNSTFNATNTSLVDVGTEPGEVYGLNGDNSFPYWDTIKLVYSNNFGQSFSSIIIDTSIIVSSNLHGFPIFTRGTIPGEFYLIRRGGNAQSYIFHTTDYGSTFELKGITDSYPDYEWGLFYSAGRGPGSFYIMRTGYNGSDNILCIDYSPDYGATFTTYCYDLVPGFTSITEQIGSSKNMVYQNQPNPFCDETTIPIYLSHGSGVEINIYDVFGNRINRIDKIYYPQGNHNIRWNTADNPGIRIVPGFYYYEMIINGERIGTKKAIKI